MNKLGHEANVRLTKEQFGEIAADTMQWKKGVGSGSRRRYAIMLEGLNMLRRKNTVISSMTYQATVPNGRFMQNYIQEKTVTESYVVPQPAAEPRGDMDALHTELLHGYAGVQNEQKA